MFPLAQRKIADPYWHSAEGHKRRGLGIAVDYVSVYEDYRAPFDGELYSFGNPNVPGGYWTGLRRDNGEKIECAHLSHYYKKSGRVKMGELVAITGNSGTQTSGPHAHIQCFDKRGNRIDPEKYNWETSQGINVKKLFSDIWKRPASRREELYFLKRIELGSIKPTRADISAKMKFWYGVMYPKGKLSRLGQLRWNVEQWKVLYGRN